MIVEVLSHTLMTSQKLFGTAEYGRRAFQQLQSTMKSFIITSKSNLKSLTDNAAMFRKFGVDSI